MTVTSDSCGRMTLLEINGKPCIRKACAGTMYPWTRARVVGRVMFVRRFWRCFTCGKTKVVL